ncbi:MAG: metallophosphoesterase [Opitutales bacterium]|nr:metallophosphoesterase [Opitutales bacterium]MCH8540926.1 metallophosphoesterase [Opitutales bacterium]
MKKQRKERCLILPDLHQDIAWAELVLEKEAGQADQIVFLGDYFDSRRPDFEIASARETAAFIKEVKSRFGAGVTLLVGNHDLPYLEGAPHFAKGLPDFSPQYPCSGFDPRKGVEIFAEWDIPWLANLNLITMVQGFLLSHAGVAPEFWPKEAAPEKSLVEFENRCQSAWENFRHHHEPLFSAGLSRGGFQETGGLLWLDWDDEFTDSLPYPQIVGHTVNAFAIEVRKKGRSYCLDNAQSTYGILTKGHLTTHEP